MPRFNMPLELGLFLGATRHSPKPCIIFEVEQYSYHRYISDLAGQDIHHHDNNVDRLVGELANWLRTQSKDETVPGGEHVAREAQAFAAQLPVMCGRRMIAVGELTFGDLNDMVIRYIAETNRASLPV